MSQWLTKIRLYISLKIKLLPLLDAFSQLDYSKMREDIEILENTLQLDKTFCYAIAGASQDRI
jgi:hypothetical protein